MKRVLPFLALVLTTTGCPNKNSNLNESDCGEQGCPIGTTPVEYRADREGYEINLAADPTTYSGEVGFKTFGESECRYQCEAAFTCSPDQFPFMTADCYACAAVVDGTMLTPQACDGTGGNSTGTGTGSGTGTGTGATGTGTGMGTGTGTGTGTGGMPSVDPGSPIIDTGF